jgi:beta-N-acetylhexosaminidase
VPALDGEVAALSPIVAEGVGGMLVLGGKVPPDLADQVGAAQRAAPTKLFVMADEEGGGVQRLAALVGGLPWPRQMAATMTVAAVQAAASRAAQRMSSLGVNVDLAPVLDVDGGAGPNARDPDGLRSISSDPAVVATYGTAFIEGLLQGGVMPVVKHFPGLGGATGNTDYGPAETQPLARLKTTGLPPFVAAINKGAPAVMVSHATVPGLTEQPASLSAAITQGLLRGQLGFRGLVVTDSLSANAISAAGYTTSSAAVAAIEAGADMVLFGSTLTPAETALLSPANVAASTTAIVNALVAAVTAGSLSANRLDGAVLAVLTAKGLDPCAT